MYSFTTWVKTEKLNSIACYFFPIIFMVYNAIAQSDSRFSATTSVPEIRQRVHGTLPPAPLTADRRGCSVVLPVTTRFSADLPWYIDSSYPAPRPGRQKDFPCLLPASCASACNIVLIGYFQSVERDRPATAITLLRGLSSSCSVSG